MTVLARIQREPAALLGFIAAVIGVLTITGVLTPEVGGSIATAVGAAVALLRYVVTPAAEVVAQQLPDGTTVAGEAAGTWHGAPVDLQAGQPIEVDVNRRRRDDTGANTVQTAGATLLILAMAAVLLVLVL